MRYRLVTIILLLFNATAYSQPAVSLKPLEGDKGMSIENTQSISGTCGKSLVRITGITNLVDDFFTLDPDAGIIIVRRSYDKVLKINDSDEIFDDYSGLVCIPTKTGDRLFLWTFCGGKMCGESLKYFVINPGKPAFISPKNGACDGKCASKHLDQHPLPLNIEKRFNANFEGVEPDFPADEETTNWR